MSKHSKTNNNRMEFLLTYFKQEKDHYEEVEVNGWWLIKQWNGGAKKWEVHIYSPESFKNYKNFNQGELDYEQHQRGFENAINREDR